MQVRPRASHAMKARGPVLASWISRNFRLLVLSALVLFAYVAALVRPQQLPWAIASLLAATLLTGVLWPEWLVKRLSATRVGPTRAAEGESVTFHVELSNHGWLPRFMVELVDRLPFIGAAEGTEVSAEVTLGVISHVAGRGRRHFETSLVCEKRGLYHLGPLVLASSFPLGLMQARQGRNEGVRTLTVYPQIFPIVDLPLYGAPSQIHRGSYMLPQGAGSAEFSGLREYARGDNPRHIHWPSTARLNELMVKDFEPVASACLCFALDLASDANAGKGKHATLEYAIRIAASMANFSCAKGIPTRMVGHGEQVLSIPSGSGEYHYQTILDQLAVLDADGSTPYAAVLESVITDCRAGETVVVFLSEPEARYPATLQALALLRARGAYVLIVHFDRASFFVSDKVRIRRNEQAQDAFPGLEEVATHCVRVKRGDDLAHLFNA